MVTIEERLSRVERQNRAMKRVGMAVVLVAAALTILGASGQNVPEDLTVRSLSVVDENGTRRVWVGAQSGDEDRVMSEFAGILMFDATGSERGGWSTDEYGRITLAMDAPEGVGHPMPDRLSLAVDGEGRAMLRMLNNETEGQVMIGVVDGQGKILLFDWAEEKLSIKTTDFHGSSVSEQPRNYVSVEEQREQMRNSAAGEE